MSLTGMHLPSPSISPKSSSQVKRPTTALRVIERVLVFTTLWSAAALTAHAQEYTFTTLAGVGGSAGYNNSTTGDATNKPYFYSPAGVVVDSSGNYIVADAGNHTIRKITPAGVVTTLAGTGTLAGHIDATGNAARFASPQGPAIDGAGNIYVADFLSNTIRKITPAGVVTTVAGLSGAAGSTDATGTAARFNGPSSVAVDNSGNIYVADSLNNRIRKIDSAGVVTTFAGSTNLVAGSLDGTGTTAFFYRPRGVAVDAEGNVYVADANNNTIRKITPAAVVSTIAGTAGAYGNTDSTVGTDARFDFPASIAIDSARNLIVADQANHTIRKITPAGAVTTIAGKAPLAGLVDSLTGTDARFYRPSGVACDSNRNIIVSDYSNQLIRRIAADSPYAVSSIAGVAGTIGVQDGSGVLLISPSLFSGPSSTATDTAGNIYVADTNNSVIRKITPIGITTTFAGQALFTGTSDTNTSTGVRAAFTNPAGVAVDKVDGYVIVADTANHTIRQIDPTGTVTTLAGSARLSGDVDGAGSNARFNFPSSVTVDNNHNIYVADYGNNKIRKIAPVTSVDPVTSANVVTWVVSTLAGSGTVGSANGSGGSASFNHPRGIAFDSVNSVLYVGDTQNHVIRKVTLAGDVSLVAGSAGTADSKDATGTAARFNGPNAVAVSSSGVIYVADTNNHTIRAISPAGVVTTIASLPGRIGSVDGTGRDVRFNQPTGISVDADDVLYVADYRNNTIRRGFSSSGKGSAAGGYDGGNFDNTGNNGGGGSGGSGTPTGNGLILRPGGLASDSLANLIVADTANNSIKKITLASDGSGTVTVIAGKDGTAGSADGTGTAASFNGPTAIVNDGADNFYVVDTGNATIRKISSTGVVTIFAGSPGNRGSLDGVGTAALFSSPAGIDIDNAGNLYVSDAFTSTIRKITTTANTATTPTIPAATVTTFAGVANSVGETDGVGTAARFNNPTGLSIDSNSILYVADTNNNTIRSINTLDIPTYASDGTTQTGTIVAGTVRTLAGSPGISGSYDGTGSYALFSNPTGVAASRTAGNVLYVADTGNNLIRKITSGSMVFTLAGNAGIAGYRDGTNSISLFNQPKAILFRGNVFVADTGNSSIRAVSELSVTGISLKLPTSTTPDPTPTPTPTPSSGGGYLETWLVGGLLGIYLLMRRSRRTFA